MFANQLVYRNVVVKGTNQVIAIHPGVVDRRVAFGSMRFGITDPVHPVPCPPWAELWAGQQLIDQRFNDLIPSTRIRRIDSRGPKL